MKRVLFFIESLSGGGAEKVLVTYLRFIDKQKFAISLLTMVDTGVLKEEIDFSQIHYLSVIHPTTNKIQTLWNKIKYKLFYYYLPSRWVSQLVIPRGYDLYVAFTEGYATKLLSTIQGVKFAWVHTDLKTYPWTLDKHIYQDHQEEINVFKTFNRVICVSDSVERVMKCHYGLSNTMTVWNPVDSERIQSLSHDFSDVRINPEGLNMISVGRLVSPKGYDKLIPMIARLRKEKLEINLYIIGEGEQRGILESIIRREHLAESVHLLGYYENPYAIMSKMDLFVCSSLAEGYSLVIAEALVLGIPVVSMNCAGPDYLLDGGKYGILCDSFDSLYDSLKLAASNRLFLMDLKRRALARQGFFDIRQTINQVETLIDSI